MINVQALRDEKERLERIAAALDLIIELCVNNEEAPVRKLAESMHKSNKASQKVKKERKCGNCGKSGHRSDKCGGGAENVKRGDDGPFAADLADDEEDDFAPPIKKEVTRAEVQELKESGLDSIRIASLLHTSLKEVNKHW